MRKFNYVFDQYLHHHILNNCGKMLPLVPLVIFHSKFTVILLIGNKKYFKMDVIHVAIQNYNIFTSTLL